MRKPHGFRYARPARRRDLHPARHTECAYYGGPARRARPTPRDLPMRKTTTPRHVFSGDWLFVVWVVVVCAFYLYAMLRRLF